MKDSIRDNLDELKFMLKKHNRMSNAKICIIVCISVLTVIAITAAIVCYFRCCDCDEFYDFEDDFDDDDMDFEE